MVHERILKGKLLTIQPFTYRAHLKTFRSVELTLYSTGCYLKPFLIRRLNGRNNQEESGVINTM